MSRQEELRKALGQLFIIGFNGLELSDDLSAFISQADIGGVILYAHNYESPGQVAELINQIQECRTHMPLWISVDHEGGKGQRFKKGFTRIPEASQIAQVQSSKTLFEISEMIAKELKSVGINLNFSLVADIATNAKNSAIGGRAYGSDEESVSRVITALVRGHMVAGVQPCVKHFPGHGDTSQDSHVALPRVENTLATLEEREFRPFVKAFKSRCSMVMTGHVLNPKLDPEFPATLSTATLQGILRKHLRYSKVVVSDDMEMKSITDHYGPKDAPRLALQAGCDILLYRTEAGARSAYEALLKDIESGKLPAEVVVVAESRVKALKQASLMPYKPITISDLGQKIGIPEHQAMIEKALQGGSSA